MSVRNLNWYNLQTTRRYPLDDSGAGETDEHNNLPNDILVDAHIRFPATLGQYAYVQAVTISPNLVTVLIGASQNLDDEGQTIAAVSLPRPITQNANYDIQAFVPGAAGWLTFGPGANEILFSGRFASPRKTLLTRRCARAYRPLPIPTIKKVGLNTALTDQVTLLGAAPVEAVYERVIVNGKMVNAITFRLNQNDATFNYNPLSKFLSTCGQRPESNTCPKIPIETINGVSPDCDGNIILRFTNLVGQNFTGCGGIDVLTPLTLSQVCAGGQLKKRSFYNDLCCPTEVANLAERDAIPIESLSVGTIVKVSQPTVVYWKVASIVDGAATWQETTEVDAICGWPDPTEMITTTTPTLLAMQDYPCVPLPVCVDFCSCDPSPPLFETRRGLFSPINTQAPFGCAPCGENVLDGLEPDATAEAVTRLTSRNTYASVDGSGPNVATFKNCATDWAYNKRIAAQFKIGPDGLERNGGIVINYYHDTTTVPAQVKYLVALLDVSRNELRLLRYVNDAFVEEARAAFPVKTKRWYELIVTPIYNGTGVTLNIVVNTLTGAQDQSVELTTALTLDKYGTPTGAFGLYSHRSITYFNRFIINE